MADNPGRQLTPVDQIRGDLQRMEAQFAAALPAHIPAERFCRVVMTAIQNNPRLLNCRRQSLFNAAMRAAQDGLLPDGREGAIVPYGDKDEETGGKASDTASWMPMILGIRKKARNSGEISDWYAEVVHEGDEFDYQLGDDPHIRHKPALNGGRTRPIVAAYSICKFKDGTIAREVMTIDEIEDVRKHYSRSKRGPWSDAMAYPEMCRKTVARLHSKQLPMSTDLDTLLRRDDELYDFKAAREEGEKATRKRGRPSSTKAALDHFAGEDNPGNEAESEPDSEFKSAGLGDDQPAEDVKETAREQRTRESREAMAERIRVEGDGPVTSPKTPEAYFTFARASIEKMDNKDIAKRWFNETTQRQMRKDIGIPVDETLKFVEEVFGK